MYKRQVYKDGNIYRQSDKRGKTDDTVKIVGQCDESLHGTKVHFLPDPEIFEETVYAVSYTHLDVYKRQVCMGLWRTFP